MKYVIVGNGKMGRKVASLIPKEDLLLISAYGEDSDFNNLKEDYDVIIDFSHPAISEKVIDIAFRNRKMLVMGTSINDEMVISKLKKASEKIPIVFQDNFSYGIYLFKKMLRAIKDEISDFDIVLEEYHHKEKRESQSSTFLGIKNILDSSSNLIMSNYRVGNIVGIHEVKIILDEEIIYLKHQAFSRKVYALGALRAAKMLKCKPNGLYTYEDLI